MTESEWVASEDPEALLLFLSESGASGRKARLFGCACVRRVWADLVDNRLRQVIEVAERYVEGTATVRQLGEAREEAERLCEGSGDIIADHGPMAVSSLCESTAGWFVPAESSAAVAAEARSDEGADWDTAHQEELRAQSGAIRDIFGNPFRPVTIDPSWLTETVTVLARTIYDERAFDRLPILADALMDAGCDDEQLLGHCRSEGPHVRGCFVVDLLLGKE